MKHMEISEHYPPFSKKTLIVVTNNDSARLFRVEKRSMEQIKTLGRKPKEEMQEPYTIEERQKLYQQINRQIKKHLKADYEDITLCAPEVRREPLMAELDKEVLEIVGEIVPKNLASLDESQIMRILQEGR